MQIAVLGAGAWGTALAVTLAGQHVVSLWTRSVDTCIALHTTRQHPNVLPGVRLPEIVQVTPLLTAAIDRADVVLVSVAVAGVRQVLTQVAEHGYTGPVVLACKGFERDTGLLPHELAAQILRPGSPVLSLSGPSFASEVAAGLPAALVLSGTDPAQVDVLRQALHLPRLRLYSNCDPTGVEIAGAMKNVIAIAAGMADGMGLGLNARAALVTRGLAEIRRLGEAMGARAETFLGLAGLGDLMLTCTATLSRNYRVGQALAQGRALPDILADLGEVAEGVWTARSVPALLERTGVEMPISSAVAAVLAGHLAPEQALQQLLGRDPRAEH